MKVHFQSENVMQKCTGQTVVSITLAVIGVKYFNWILFCKPTK